MHAVWGEILLRQTEPVWMDKPAACIEGVSIGQSDDHSSLTQLNKEKCPTEQRYMTKQK